MTKWITAILAAVTIGGATLMAANLSNNIVNTCEGAAEFHFVNNQTGGAAAGTLTATFTDGTTCITGPDGVNQNTQHFFCDAEGQVSSASTDLPGRLVLSHITCDEKEPPTCDPEKDPNCKP